MKCLIINGSNHIGNTWEFVKLFKDRIQEKYVCEFEEIHLGKIDLPFCLGCNNCFLKSEAKCPHAKIIQPIVEKIDDSDILIIATPSYSLNISALMKNFIDHMSYVFHRPRYPTKKALVLSTAAGAGANKSVGYIKKVLTFWGFNKVYTHSLACFEASGYIPTEKHKHAFLKTADKFIKDIYSNKLHSPNISRIFFYNIWRAASSFPNTQKNPDYIYWMQTGLSKIPYHSEVPLSYLKKVIGNMFYMLFKLMFKNN